MNTLTAQTSLLNRKTWSQMVNHICLFPPQISSRIWSNWYKHHWALRWLEWSFFVLGTPHLLWMDQQKIISVVSKYLSHLSKKSQNQFVIIEPLNFLELQRSSIRLALPHKSSISNVFDIWKTIRVLIITFFQLHQIIGKLISLNYYHITGWYKYPIFIRYSTRSCLENCNKHYQRRDWV